MSVGTLGLAIVAILIADPVQADECPPEAARFADVASPVVAKYVNNLVWHGIAAGCGAGLFCPDSTITRDQMAVYLIKGRYAASYVPPPATGTLFNDVPAGPGISAYMEKAYAEGIMAPCESGRFCPTGTVTRGDMAVFLLKAEEGASYTPPSCNGTSPFSDISASDPLCPYAKELVARGITAGCGDGTTYCPLSDQTRGQMAVFITTTFKLPLAATSKYGIVAAGGTANDTRAQIDIAALGSGWVRANLKWHEMERTRGNIDFTEADKLINAMDARGGTHLYWDFSYAPCWANDQVCAPGTETDDQFRFPPLVQQDLYNFVHAVVSRYRGRNIYWGTWNEPNLGQFYVGGVDAYIAKEFKTTLNAIRAADPLAKIVVGEISSSTNYSERFDVLHRMLDAAPQPFNVISQHIYDGNESCGQRLAGVDLLRTKLIQWGYGDKPIWITETGILDNPTNPVKARMLRCFYGVMETRPWWEKSFWFRYENLPQNGGNIGMTDGGASDCSRQPNQTYFDYQAVAKATIDNRFDADKSSYSDLFVRNLNTGVNTAWQTRKGVYVSTVPMPENGDVTWKIVGTGDFNGDRKYDILWRSQDGSNWVWPMDGTVWLDQESFHLQGMPQPWEVAGTGDMNNDGYADIAWHNPTTKENVVWMTSGPGGPMAIVLLASHSAAYRMIGTGQFSKDGTVDILWRNQTTGAVEVWLIDPDSVLRVVGTAAFSNSPDLSWTLAATADLDRDGKTDVVWQRNTGQVEAWLMDGTARRKVIALPSVPAGTSIVAPK